MKKVQESKTKDIRVMDSFIKKAWLYLLVAFLFPAFGAMAQTQDNMKNKNTRTDTTKTRTQQQQYNKSTRSTTTDTSRTYRYNENQNMNQQNQNQNQQNRNRYDNQKGDTLQGDRSRDAVLIENEPKK